MEQKRLARLRGEMQELKLDAVLVTNSRNRRYLTGFTGTSGHVVVTAERACFLTDSRYTIQAAKQVKHYEVIEHIQSNPIASVRELLLKAGIRQLGFEQNDVTYGAYAKYAKELDGIELVPTGGLVEKLRMIKDEQELQVIQEACDLADRTFAYILPKLRPGVTERQIALDMEVFMRENGAVSSSFDTIIASGLRSAMPHGVASDKPLAHDGFVTLDFGAYYKGYCSDLTRTVFMGKPTEKHKEIYRIVREAQEACLQFLKPGISGREGDAAARDVIRQAGYGEYFGHGTGHSFGMDIHEEPRLSPYCEVAMQAGMTMTAEPGIYIPDFGGVRIEDDVVFTAGGIRLLTHSPKDFTVID